MHVWNVLHAARWKYRMQKNRHFGTIAQLCRAISSQLRHVSTIGRTLVKQQISPRYLYNMANFGLLAAEICRRVWGTPANFNGFRVLAALLYGSLVVGVSQTAALNRGRHLYSAGRPSRWALAHMSSFFSVSSYSGLEFNSVQKGCVWSSLYDMYLGLFLRPLGVHLHLNLFIS